MNQPPAAQFMLTCVGLHCTGDASASTDDVGVATYTWTWGNGKSKVVTMPMATTTFYLPAVYSVTRVVTDGAGLTGTLTKRIPIGL